MNSFDLTQYKVVAEQDIEEATRAGATAITVREGAIFTPSARDLAASRGMTVTTSGAPAAGSPAGAGGAAGRRLFTMGPPLPLA